MVRQVLCETKECELLPANHSSVGSGRDNILAASGGLNPEPASSGISLSSVTPRRRKRKQSRRTVKSSRSSKKTQVGGKRGSKVKSGNRKKKCANKRKR